LAVTLFSLLAKEIKASIQKNFIYLLSALLETGLGKKSAFIVLDKPNDVKQLKVLINQADIL
jgi:hypothetical protein